MASVKQVIDPTKAPGEPGYVRLEEERKKAPTKAEIQWAMLHRLETAGQARSKVSLTRNAKHEIQWSVEVAGEDVDECRDKAVEIEKSLTTLYPPPAAIEVELGRGKR